MLEEHRKLEKEEEKQTCISDSLALLIQYSWKGWNIHLLRLQQIAA